MQTECSGNSDTRPINPRRAGEVAPDVTIGATEAYERLQRAFANAAAGAADRSAATQDLVWVDGDNELLVRTSRMRVVIRTGFVLIGITVYTERTGDVEIVVPIALGAPGDPLGLIMATEKTPRGSSHIVELWGDQLIATAWDALMRVATDVAVAAGVDDEHQPLLPIALVADKRGLTVTPQARHSFDRRRQ